MFRARYALPAAILTIAALAAACGSSSTKSGSGAAQTSTTHAMMHETTTTHAMMHESTTTGAAMMAHTVGSMSGDYIKAADQSSDGSKLTVEDVGLHMHSGFVVAVADNGGAMGDVLGVSTLVHPGATMGVTVPLTKPLSASAKVFLVLHVDNGDGTFTSADAPAMDGANVVELPIEVTVH